MPVALTTYFPPVVEETFDAYGLTTSNATTLTAFDTVADTGSLMTFPHYSELAAISGMGLPYRGSHCMRIENDGATDCHLIETGSSDLITTERQYYRFYFWLDPNMTLGDTDSVPLLALKAGGAFNLMAGIEYTTAAGLRVGLGKATFANYLPVSLGQWHCMEVNFLHSTAGAGTVDGWLDGAAFTQLASQTNVNITDLYFGAENPSGLEGTILLDQFVIGTVDTNARIGMLHPRHPETLPIRSSQTLFVGPGTIENITLVDPDDAAILGQVRLYDTDNAHVDEGRLRLVLRSTADGEIIDPAGTPIHFKRGCYADMTHQNATTSYDTLALAKICKGARHDGEVRTYASKRTATVGDY